MFEPPQSPYLNRTQSPYLQASLEQQENTCIRGHKERLEACLRQQVAVFKLETANRRRFKSIDRPHPSLGLHQPHHEWAEGGAKDAVIFAEGVDAQDGKYPIFPHDLVCGV